MKHLSREQRINLAFVAFFCLVSVVWVAVFTTRNFENRDAYDYAQMGREIVQGHGLATKQIFPRHIGYLKDRGILTPQRLPNLYRYPLPTFTNALAQVFIADPIRASVIQCGTWFLLSIPAFFLLIRKLVDPLVALVCTILFVALPGVWLSSNNGMSESLTILLLLLLLHMLTMQRMSIWRYVGLGISGGLLCLARTQFAYVVVAACIYLAVTMPKPERFPAIAWSVVTLLLMLSPWMIRNYSITGNPLFSFHNTRVLVQRTDGFTDLDMQLHAPTGLLEVLRQHWRKIARKFLNNVQGGLVHPNKATAPYIYIVIALFITERALKPRNESVDYTRFKWFIVTLVAINTFIVCLIISVDRFNFPLQPLLAVVVVQELLTIAQFKGLQRFGKCALVALAMLGGTFIVLNARQRYPQTTAAMCERLRQIVNPRNVIAADVSYKTALLNNVLTIRLPHYPEELIEISDKYIPIDYVILDNRILNVGPGVRSGLTKGYVRYGKYGEFVKSDSFQEKFEFSGELPEGGLLYKRRADKNSR